MDLWYGLRCRTAKSFWLLKIFIADKPRERIDKHCISTGKLVPSSNFLGSYWLKGLLKISFRWSKKNSSIQFSKKPLGFLSCEFLWRFFRIFRKFRDIFRIFVKQPNLRAWEGLRYKKFVDVASRKGSKVFRKKSPDLFHQHCFFIQKILKCRHFTLIFGTFRIESIFLLLCNVWFTN